MGLDPSESFRQLRPICIKLSKEPSPQNIKDLECKLRTVDATHDSSIPASGVCTVSTETCATEH